MTNAAASRQAADQMPSHTDATAIPPVRKSIRVRASQARAFEVFTEGLDRWWPRKASIGTAPMKCVTIEPRLGGRWYETGEDGSQCDVGKILLWDPPSRFIMSWDLNSHWQPDPSVGSEVEVRFIAEGPGVTLVEVEHRKFERMGIEGGSKMRNQLDNGWPGMLEKFRATAEA
jgi:uncharacterized protein YndB with AHSA1/START domain